MDFANLFVETEAGELLYFLMAVSLSLAALLIAIEQGNRSPQENAARRYMAALLGVLAAWGILTLGNLSTILIENANRDMLLPPLERAVNVVVILLLTWVFLTAESEGPEKSAQSIVIGMIVLVAIGYVFSVATWEAKGNEFNRHSLGLAWTLIPILFVSLGVFLLLWRYRFAADIPLKLIFALILLAGHFYTLYQMGQDDLGGNVAGILRVSMLAAMPLLPVIVYRMVIERFRKTVGDVSGFVQTQAVYSPPEAFKAPGAKAQQEAVSLLKILGMMLEKTDPTLIPMQIVRAVATTFNADVVALMAVNNPSWADPMAAYNFIKEQNIPNLVLNLQFQQTLVSAIELNIQTVALPTRNSEELSDLFTRLDVLETGPSGPAYFQPLSQDRKVVGILILALPYTTRLLNEQERAHLEALGPIAARLLGIARAALSAHIPSHLPEIEAEAASTQQIRVEMQQLLEKSQGQINDLHAQIDELNRLLGHERHKISELAKSTPDMSITQQINTLAVEREGLRLERENLVQALQNANTLLVSATADNDAAVYRQMLDNLTREKQSLQAERGRLEKELMALRSSEQDRDRLQEIINALMAEKARLQEDHDRMRSEIHDAEKQLSNLGIEEGMLGFAQLVAHLTEERNRFLNISKRAMAERDFAQRQLMDIQDQREHEEGRTQQITQLKTEIHRIASDREALLRQNQTIKAERDSLNQQREDWLSARILMVEANDQLRRELEKTKSALRKSSSAYVQFGEAPPTSSELSQLRQRLDEVEESRSDLEFQWLAAQKKIDRLVDDIAYLEEQLALLPTKSEDNYETAQMVVSLAQELRTPLTSILGYNELLLGESMGILGESQRQFLLRIQVNVENLLQLVENLIRAIAIDYGGLSLEPRRVDMQDLIDDAITASSAQYREKSLNLALDIPEDLPPILADRDAMQQILTRLLTNAYLVSPAHAAVEVSARHVLDFRLNEADKPQEVVFMAVKDYGGGIPTEDQSRVFNRHYRVENPLIQGLGDKGAGLSIAKALIQAHGGKIWLETEPHTSTTFKLVIPINHAFGENHRGSKITRLISALKNA